MIKDILVYFVLFLTNMIQAITGFAGTLLAMPATMHLIGVNEAKALLNAVAQISCFFIVCSSWKNINWKEFIKMFILMILGMVLGNALFEIFPLSGLLLFYGVLIIIIALWKLFIHHTLSLPSWISYLTILMAGVIHGMFVSGGALLVIYASSALKDKQSFRSTMALIWVTLGFYMTGLQIQQNHFNQHVIMLLIIGLIPVFLGTWCGSQLVERIKQETFMKLTYILLLLSGILVIM